MKNRNINDVTNHQSLAINKFVNYINSLVSSSDEKLAKADKLLYWVENWTDYLIKEETFDSRKLRRYKRGEIIKVNLGFNIGSEEGGLHYAVVIDKVNAISDPTVRVIPLTSVKPHKDVMHLPNGSVFLGNELFTSLSAKISSEKRNIGEQILDLQNLMEQKTIGNEELAIKVKKLKKELQLLDGMNREISKMKKGSIALVSQITTISKIRIYDPRTNHDILSNIKLSNEKLDLIDECIISMFTK